ncbi:MAG: hypothetical protein V7695_02835 [Sulfitobacter sp.]
MSTHPHGSKADLDAKQLVEFKSAVEAYSLARQLTMTYEASKDDHPEAFTIVDQAELTQRHVAQFMALQRMQAQALVLQGSGILQRCINALEAQSDG